MFDTILEILAEIARALIWITLGFLIALGTVYAIAHAMDNWDEPEHPYSGYTPDYHTAHLEP